MVVARRGSTPGVSGMEREGTSAPRRRHPLHPGLLASGYFITGWLALRLPHGEVQIPLVWLPTGIAIAALYRWGWRCWRPVASPSDMTRYRHRTCKRPCACCGAVSRR